MHSPHGYPQRMMAEHHNEDNCLRLLIVDDQPVIRRGLAMMLALVPGLEVVAQAADGAEAIEMAAEHQPDVVVMDLQMPKVSGVVATREITTNQPGTQIVILTTYDDDEQVFEAIRAGAQAYLLKDASESEVVETIKAVHRGESRLSPSVAGKMLNQFRLLANSPQNPPQIATVETPDNSRPDDEPLTVKEEEILGLIAKGQSNKSIATGTNLAEGTVKNYVSRIMTKLHAGSRTELAVRAVTRKV